MSLDVTACSSSSAYGPRSTGQMGLRTGSSSVLGGAGGVGSPISVMSIQKLAGVVRPYFQAQNIFPLSTADDKETMRSLNNRLAEYLTKVRSLEESNSKLEAQIKEASTRRGADGPRDWSEYENTLAVLKKQMTDLIMDNGRLMLHIDNARLAADDFNIKFETERSVRQAVEADIANLRKMIDDTNMARLQLEGQVESFKEELELLHKNHQEDMQSLRDQIKSASVDVQMDTPKAIDLNETITKIRQQYENAVQKNLEDSESWFRTKLETASVEIVRSTETLQEDKNQLSDLHRQYKVLEIELMSLHSMNHSLEDTLRDTSERYTQALSHHNSTIQQLEAELGEMRGQVISQRADYEALLSIKTKLQEEICTYQRLLEGTDVEDGVQGPDEHDDGKVKGAGAHEDMKNKGAGARDDMKIKGAGAREDIIFNGAGARDDAKDKSAGARDSIEDEGLGAYEDVNTSDNDSAEFSLEQALYSVPPGLNPEKALLMSEETADIDVVPQRDPELSVPPPVATVKQEEEQKETVGNEEAANGTMGAGVGRELQEEQEVVQQEEEEPIKPEAEPSESEDQLEE